MKGSAISSAVLRPLRILAPEDMDTEPDGVGAASGGRGEEKRVDVEVDAELPLAPSGGVWVQIRGRESY